MTKPRVLLADDHRMMAEGLKSLLEEDFELAGIVEDGRALVKAVREVRPCRAARTASSSSAGAECFRTKPAAPASSARRA